MKFLSFLCLHFFLLCNSVFAETILTKSEILKKSNECIKYPQNYSCEKLILRLESFQLVEFQNNRFRCQTSILGLQTEIVEGHFFRNSSKSRKKSMIPYVIKNC